MQFLKNILTFKKKKYFGMYILIGILAFYLAFYLHFRVLDFFGGSFLQSWLVWEFIANVVVCLISFSEMKHYYMNIKYKGFVMFRAILIMNISMFLYAFIYVLFTFNLDGF